jgi:hypothetical protein
MQVSLKKAFEYEKAAFAAIQKITLVGSISISIYNKADVVGLIYDARTKSEQGAHDIFALVDAGNALHGLRSELNNRCGINKLLTDLAGLDHDEGNIASVISKISSSPTMERRGYRESFVVVDPAEVIERINDARKKKDAETAFTGTIPESVTVAVFDEASLAVYSDKLNEIRYKKQEIKDQLVMLNLTNKIEIPKQVIDTLRKNKIIK